MTLPDRPDLDVFGADRRFKTGSALGTEKFELRRKCRMAVAGKCDHRALLSQVASATSELPRIGEQQQFDQRTQVRLQPVKAGGQHQGFLVHVELSVDF